jgi:hypothetical protein
MLKDMKDVPAKAFIVAARSFSKLCEPETLVILTHLVNTADWTVDTMTRVTGYSKYKVRTILGFLKSKSIVKTESIGNQIVYNIKLGVYEQYCGAAARIL